MRHYPYLCALLLVAGCLTASQDKRRDLVRDGDTLFRSGAFADAKESYRAALKEQSNDAVVYYKLGRCNQRLGKPDDAEACFRKAAEIDPEHESAHHELVARMVATGRRKEAAALVAGWGRVRPKLAGPLVEQAGLTMDTGDLDSARAQLQEALRREPRHARAMRELGKLYERTDRLDRALALYERSLENDADQPDLRERVAELKRRGVGPPRPD